jgi:OOP family OmpA-OmpF porin
MKTTRLFHFGILAMALPFCGNRAHAEDSRSQGTFYTSVNLGTALVQDAVVERSRASPFGAKGAEIEFHPGPRINVGMGYHLTRWLAVEVETGVAINLTEKAGVFPHREHLFYQVPVMGNVVVHIPTGSRLHAFLGAGAGGVSTAVESYDAFESGHSEEDFGFAWQAFAGVRYQVNDRVEVGVAYQFLRTTDRTFDSFSATIGAMDTHSVTASLSVTF